MLVNTFFSLNIWIIFYTVLPEQLKFNNLFNDFVQERIEMNGCRNEHRKKNQLCYKFKNGYPKFHNFMICCWAKTTVVSYFRSIYWTRAAHKKKKKRAPVSSDCISMLAERSASPGPVWLLVHRGLLQMAGWVLLWSWVAGSDREQWWNIGAAARQLRLIKKLNLIISWDSQFANKGF